MDKEIKTPLVLIAAASDLLISLLRRGLPQSRWVETRGGWEEGKFKARGEAPIFSLQRSRFPLFSFTGVY